MTVAAISPRSGRRLTAAGRARREKLDATRRRRKILAAGGALTIVFAAPLSIAAYMGVDASFPGIEAAKSFMAMMADRSPGDRTKGELTKTKQAAAADVPTQRALGKITKPEPPKEFVDAIAPPVPRDRGASAGRAEGRHRADPADSAASGRWHHHSAAGSSAGRRRTEPATAASGRRTAASAAATGRSGARHLGDDAARLRPDRLGDAPPSPPDNGRAQPRISP